MNDTERILKAPGRRLGGLAIGLLALTSVLAWLALSPGAGAAEQRSGATGFTVGIATTPLGKIVVDARGHSLYLFEADHKGSSACYGACATYWPPLLSSAGPRAARGVRASLLGVTKRTDGKRQVTYAGHPLYTYVGDTKAGMTSGEGLTDFGGTWDAVAASGRSVESTPSDPNGSDGGYGGYGSGS